METIIQELKTRIDSLTDEQRLEYMNHRAGMMEGLAIAITVIEQFKN